MLFPARLAAEISCPMRGAVVQIDSVFESEPASTALLFFIYGLLTLPGALAERWTVGIPLGSVGSPYSAYSCMYRQVHFSLF